MGWKAWVWLWVANLLAKGTEWPVSSNSTEEFLFEPREMGCLDLRLRQLMTDVPWMQQWKDLDKWWGLFRFSGAEGQSEVTCLLSCPFDFFFSIYALYACCGDADLLDSFRPFCYARFACFECFCFWPQKQKETLLTKMKLVGNVSATCQNHPGFKERDAFLEALKYFFKPPNSTPTWNPWSKSAEAWAIKATDRRGLGNRKTGKAMASSLCNPFYYLLLCWVYYWE